MKAKYPIGLQFVRRQYKKISRIETIMDILRTYNSNNELVKIRYMASHELMGQTIIDCDIVETTIAMSSMVLNRLPEINKGSSNG